MEENQNYLKLCIRHSKLSKEDKSLLYKVLDLSTETNSPLILGFLQLMIGSACLQNFSSQLFVAFNATFQTALKLEVELEIQRRIQQN